MYQAFEADVMDDLFYDAAEGPSQTRRSAQSYDAYDEYDDSFDEYDDSFDAYDQYDAYDEGDAYDAYDQGDTFEDAMADALEAEDSDEFFRRVTRGIRRVANVARQVGRGVGSVARVVAPIAAAIPLPQAQAVARVARVAGRLLADGADEFEAVDALVDLAESEDLLDAAAPAIATMAVHGTMPQAARLPQATRQQLVRATTRTAQTIARQQGTQAVRALPAVVQAAQRTARQQGAPPRALPQIIQRIGTRVSRNPQLIRRLIRSASPALRQHICAACGRGRARPTAARRP
ncbi:MAG: hypothetical protein KME27_22850 [Lyngbya sp. HA4199-MV5]|jgi:hypothetical protein|nr:hypothetical protein [Lyngbya sp. HA4199-MV5]